MLVLATATGHHIFYTRQYSYVLRESERIQIRLGPIVHCQQWANIARSKYTATPTVIFPKRSRFTGSSILFEQYTFRAVYFSRL